ncbi:MAG: glycosyl transferase [Chitinophagales bacterium]|nr:MAG: glycosyl transferase [Chitinophagales bacterium]
MTPRRILIFGPGPRFKGGIANYTVSLARALKQYGNAEVHIVSWTQQYPSIIPRDFFDRESRKDLLEGTGITVKYITNYNNPFSWKSTYEYIRDWNPDMVIFQWAITLQGFPIGYISKKLTRHKEIEQVFVLHNVQQKEASRIDRLGTRCGLKYGHTFVVLSYPNARELQQMFPELKFTLTENGERARDGSRTILKLFHPVYDIFTPHPDFDAEKFKAELGLKKHVFLFFGFIRKYKGLHYAIRAFARVVQRRKDVSLLIVGESFWKTLPDTFSARLKKTLFCLAQTLLVKNKSNEQDYRPLQLIKQLHLEKDVVVVNRFVPNEEVYKYFQVADALLNFYTTSAPSGVESIAYNFALPVIATRVGHYMETIQEGYNGYLAQPGNIESMAEQMIRLIDHPIDRNHVKETARKYSWENYVRLLLNR